MIKLFNIAVSLGIILFPLCYRFYEDRLSFTGWMLIASPFYGAALFRAIQMMRKQQLSPRMIWVLLASLALVALCIYIGAGLAPFLLYPMLVSLLCTCIFAFSLAWGKPLITQIAEKRKILPESGKQYTKRLTYIWMLFLALNTIILFILATLSNLAYWALYSSVISYVLMGCLFALDLLYRWIKQREPAHE